MKRKRSVSLIILFVVIAVLLGTVSIFVFTTIKHKTGLNTIACTQEAKLCPDGSAVGRTGPNCVFAPCPDTKPNPSPIPAPTPVPLVPAECGGPGGKCPNGYTCIQKCGPPVVRVDESPPGYYCELNSVASKPRMCPICLASNTMISTPDGQVSVKEIRVGVKVWSINKRGVRIESTVLNASNMDAPKSHQMIHLVLSDKREVWLSPNHPTMNGTPVKELRVGDNYDGARVLIVDAVPYWDDKTYDLLPDSDTGMYWANGILFGSTLMISK